MNESTRLQITYFEVFAGNGTVLPAPKGFKSGGYFLSDLTSCRLVTWIQVIAVDSEK